MSASLYPKPDGLSASLQFNGTDAIVFDSTGVTAGSPQVTVRQTVIQSPVDTSGIPTFLAATYAGLIVTTQNVSTGANSLVATAAQGADTRGGINVIGQSTANLTWPSATANQTNYLPLSISGGVLTPQTPVILAPIYQWGGTPAVTAGQYTFNIQQMTMYLGNGSTAPAVNHVIVGEVVAGASTITSTVAYALMGRYDSGYIATLPAASTRTTLSHKIGCIPLNRSTLNLQCLTAENGYIIGEIVSDSIVTYSAGPYFQPIPIIYTGNNAVSFSTGATQPWVLEGAAGGAGSSLTAAKWAYKLIVNRGW